MHFVCISILLIALTWVQIIYPLETSDNNPECLSKFQLSQILKRDRRASISRPYFHHWQQTRDNSRYTVKNSLAFSPRLGKRANELDNFLRNLPDQLQDKQIEVVYEDSTEICFSHPISSQGDIRRHSPDEHGREEIHGRQTMGKHPVLFRYRLG